MRRHCRDIHGKNPDGTSAKRYRCPEEPCVRKHKLFKRRDVLKDHLQRVHGRSDYPLEECVIGTPLPESSGHMHPPFSSPPFAATPNLYFDPLSEGPLPPATYDQHRTTFSKDGGDKDNDEDDAADDDDDLCRRFVKKLIDSSETRRRILEESHLQLMEKLQVLDREEDEAKTALWKQRERIRRRKAEGYL